MRRIDINCFSIIRGYLVFAITVTFAKLSQYIYKYNDSESKESVQQCMSVADTVDSSDDLIVSLGHSYPQATLSTCVR